MRQILIFLTVFTTMIHNQVAANDFSATWHDGRAEVNGYRLTVDRYGQERQGEAVLIYVTEGLSKEHRVKVNDVARAGSDHVDTLKLNLVRDFQTGLYDYNTMTSVFVRTSDLEALKITFSSAEWCGHVFEDLRIDPQAITGTTQSYFEGESQTIKLTRPKGGLTEEELFIRLRSLRGDFLAPGAKTTVRLLPSAYVRRLSHRPAAWTSATIQRLAEETNVTVPAGDFRAVIYLIDVQDGRKGRFEIEAEWPHRLLRWSMAPDVTAELTGSKRLPYWNLNKQGNEKIRRDLGLGPLPMAMAGNAE